MSLRTLFKLKCEGGFLKKNKELGIDEEEERCWVWECAREELRMDEFQKASLRLRIMRMKSFWK